VRQDQPDATSGYLRVGGIEMNTRRIWESMTWARAFDRKTLGEHSAWRTALAALVVSAATVIASPAQTFTTLADFNSANGSIPSGTLIQASDGNFYGTTQDGGNDGVGTVFKMTPAGKLTTLYSFCAQSGCKDGEDPVAGLVQASDGNFYGTTNGGGANGNYGTVFKITPAGKLTTLYSFCAQSGCKDGENPLASLIQASDGNFYGTTNGGGANGGYNGTVFKITPAGTLTTLYSFCAQSGCKDGEDPVAGVVEGSDGNFYGTTVSGGNNSAGTVFKMTPAGMLTTLYSFCSQTGCTDGEFPYAGLVQASDGNFYGTTESGGNNGAGTVFEVTPAGLVTLYNFCYQQGCGDGGNPVTGLVVGNDGNFYGTTAIGGNADHGTVFELDTQGNGISIFYLYSFCSQTGCPDGENSRGLVQAMNGTLYGTTAGGGTSASGTVFSLALGLFNFPALGEQADYFRERKADFTVWRPSNGTWYTIDGSGKSISRPWGTNGDHPVIGDYDGDGKTDLAVWRPSNGTWYVILSKTNKMVSQPWGEKGDIPVPGDYDGDGKTDLAVWRPSTGTWFVIESGTGQVVEKPWGEKGDIPVPGDYDGDGKTDFAVWRPSTGTWFVIESSTGQVVEKSWGVSTDIPVPGDYDGDGRTDIAVWRPSNGTWYAIASSNGKVIEKQWGSKGDVPVPRDYDGARTTDFAVWRPSNGTWYVLATSTGKTITRPWGVSTDVTINKPVGQ